jgi:hypothetical protein
MLNVSHIRSRRLRNTLMLVLFWVIVTPLLLELVVRVAVPSLPPALQLAAERVQKGESLDINRIGLMTMDIDHNFMMRPDIDNALYGPKQSVVFHVSTIQILDSRMGFRTEPVQQGDKVDVAVVGDSFSFCFTEYADCWVSRFRESTGLNVMNLAQGSTGSMSHWRFIETFGQAFQPPLVIWQWFGNDFNEDYQLAVTRGEMQPIQYGPQVPAYSDQESPVAQWLRQNSVAFVVIETALFGESAYISDFERFYFTPEYTTPINPSASSPTLEFGQLYEQVAMDMTDPRNSTGVPMTEEALKNAKETVEGWGGQFVVFLIPVREEIYKSITEPQVGEEKLALFRENRETMRRLCDELELICYDLLPDLKAAADRYAEQDELLYYADDMHLNPRGNAVVAELIQNWLDQLDALPDVSTAGR